jgi:hypothetical protein
MDPQIPLITDPRNDLSLQSEHRFQLHVGRYPDFTWTVRNVQVPQITISEINQPTPYRPLPIAQSILQFETLVITLAVDAKLRTWRTLLDWMTGSNAGVSLEQREEWEQRMQAMVQGDQHFNPHYTDATVTVLTGQNTPMCRIRFWDTFPSSIGTFAFKTTTHDTEFMTLDVGFRYTYYTLESLRS